MLNLPPTGEQNSHLSSEVGVRDSVNNYCQVYTVHWFVEGTTFPSIYVLLPDKRQNTYNALWSNLKSDVKAADSAMTDFEMATMNSVGEIFAETEKR